MSDNRVYSYSAVLMGSPILLKLCSHDEAMASRVFQLIKRYEDLLTVNRAESQVMDINHAAGRHPVTVSRPVFQLIQCAKAASMVRDSAFNLAIGPLVKLWRIGFHGHSVPDAAEIRARLALTRPQEVILDEATCSVFLQQPGMELDLGAIAKGYIADRVRDYLRQQQVEKALETKLARPVDVQIREVLLQDDAQAAREASTLAELRGSVSPDGKRMVWGSDRAGGPGGGDLGHARS